MSVASIRDVPAVDRAHGSARSTVFERRRHVVATTVASFAVVGTLLGWHPSPEVAVVTMIAAVAIGLPHGALDVVIGPRMAPSSIFFGWYVLLAAAIVATWLAVPLVAFGLFFTASWFHFGRGDAEHHRALGNAGALSGAATAGCAIGLPLVFHSETVAPVLSDLLLGAATLRPEQVVVIGSIIVYPSVSCGVVAGIAAFQRRDRSAIGELVLIALLGAIVHPLVSFALYFALWHAPRHLITLDVDQAAMVPTMGATVATVFVAAIVWQSIEPSLSGITQVVFIGLAALTGPHLVVTELFRYRHRAHRGPPGDVDPAAT